MGLTELHKHLELFIEFLVIFNRLATWLTDKIRDTSTEDVRVCPL